ncbi:MAG: glutathione peroxidase [Burkholderiales bacterium RIFCSPLOWO2_12_FULL_64_99]|nr:MAG: glutathione peroxidase [Burkholderiales bacterium RIFCSPHIGHO2_12_FULL_63_20]OGB67497.1 MAG: glutathione peroxidase [Burkholderiales bacterium RIFCSPLOWO2_12_FULL_64_99]
MLTPAAPLRPWILSGVLAALSGVSGLAQAAPPATVAPAPAAATCPALLNKTFPRLQDEKPQSLCQYSGQVVLVVNTASYCGFTSQYKGLEALYAKYKSQGLVVLGFPSNDFGQQEPDSGQQIAEFCANTFGVKFPMFAKSSVKGAQANPLFAELIKLSGTSPKWNFYKYLIARDGRTVEAYNSMTAPDSRSLVADIEQALAAKP